MKQLEEISSDESGGEGREEGEQGEEEGRGESKEAEGALNTAAAAAAGGEVKMDSEMGLSSRDGDDDEEEEEEEEDARERSFWNRRDGLTKEVKVMEVALQKERKKEKKKEDDQTDDKNQLRQFRQVNRSESTVHSNRGAPEENTQTEAKALARLEARVKGAEAVAGQVRGREKVIQRNEVARLAIGTSFSASRRYFHLILTLRRSLYCYIHTAIHTAIHIAVHAYC